MDRGDVPSEAAARAAAELAARASYGKLLARVAVRTGDLSSAEDALADAFAAALTSWPASGVPSAPEAWLLAVARRKRVDMARHATLRRRPDVLAALAIAEEGAGGEHERLPDDRLRLMLVCAHPAIDPSVRPALILQVVLGIEAAAMASLFLLSPDTMTKRLVRAKAKIRASGLRFEEPEAADMEARVHALLEAVYAAYVLGREGAIAEGDARDELRREAVYLAELVAQALPTRAEPLGFLALVRFCEARRPAQVDAAGAFVPILEQDTAQWDLDAMRDGYELLGRAASLREPGPFQLEAAIHGAHCYRARTGRVPWAEVASLYRALVSQFPSVGATVGLAVATAHADESPDAGLEILLSLEAGLVQSYQPWWAALAYLHERAGQAAEAHRAFARALGLTSHPRLQAYFRAKLARSAPPAGADPSG